MLARSDLHHGTLAQPIHQVVTARSNPGSMFYRPTPTGRTRLKAEAARWQRIRGAIALILQSLGESQ